MKINGYEIICPDGKTRHYPYFSEGDAKFDAGQITKEGCFSVVHPYGTVKAGCPEGEHTVRPLVFEPEVNR